MRLLLCCILILFLSIPCVSQHQFLVFKRNEILFRYDQGYDFTYKLRGEKKKKTGFVRAIRQDTVFLWRDTIPVHEISAIYHKRMRFHNTIGVALTTVGAVYFLADQVNNSIVAGNSFSIDNRTTTSSLALVAAGVPLMYLNKNIHRKGRKYRFITVDMNSPFYMYVF
ncbi:MAG TPA: hypothetical protein PKC24_05355 [Cyclobacteriaceae bacterium]|nr:hypothetical protein [Cyclobacteriaceae bacterium]